MNIILSITLSLLLTILAYIKKALTTNALLCAFIFACLITYFGGFISYLILVLVFLGTLIGSKIGAAKRIQINHDIIKKPHKKDTYQILANVGLGTLFIIIYGFTNNFIYLIIYASIMAESLSDSLASDIGVLSKKPPINILTFKKSIKGLSGNISLLGICSSLIGSLIISSIFYIFYHQFSSFLAILLSGFLGTIVDSVLGSTIQVKYKCQKCLQITEREEHCQIKTKYYKGFKFINNDCVNFLSNVSTSIISYIIIILIK